MRTGDHVLHKPTGETWIVAYVDGEHMSWVGWPNGEAKVSDCEVTKACTDKEHHDWLTRIVKDGDGKRGRMARETLKSLQPQN